MAGHYAFWCCLLGVEMRPSGGGMLTGQKLCVWWEMNSEAATVYGANHDHPVLQLNIADWVGVSQALEQYGPFDLVQWSPPYQPHSNANANKIKDDPR